MSLKGLKVFARKPYSGRLYKWGVMNEDKKAKKESGQGKVVKISCNATANSQGEDFITGYVFERVVINSVVHQYAYVECDYVE